MDFRKTLIKLTLFDQDLGPKLQGVAFTLGVMLGSYVVGYYLVSGNFKNCFAFYGIMDSKVKLLQE